MTAAENKELLARYMSEVWDRGNLDAIRGFLAPGFQRHVSAVSDPLDIEGQIGRLAGFREAFPDITISVQDVVAEGDLVAFRSTMRGTHSGTFAGMPPSGRRVTVGLLDLIRIEDGLFAEQWGGPDLFDLVRQLRA